MKSNIKMKIKVIKMKTNNNLNYLKFLLIKFQRKNNQIKVKSLLKMMKMNKVGKINKILKKKQKIIKRQKNYKYIKNYHRRKRYREKKDGKEIIRMINKLILRMKN